jgi:hypothetical protein
MKGAGSADDDWDDFCVGFESAVCLKRYFEWLIDVIYMVDDRLYVAVGGVLAFNDL